MEMKKLILILLFLALIISILPAQDDRYTLKVVVVGPGDELYLWWGHIALIIEDSITGRSILYDYGRFNFDQENFFTNFAVGRLNYHCGMTRTDYFMQQSIFENRDVIVYTLDVPVQNKQKVKEFAENNVRPENMYYQYHHFKDNCSTRIRDIIDIAVDGQFKEKYFDAPGRFTLRQHVRRHTWFSPEADWILNFWMGQVIDNTLTVWEEMFLPSEVGKVIEDYYYTDSNGVNRKLVTNVEMINRAINRPAVLDTPVPQWPGKLIFSLVLFFIFGFFYYLIYKEEKAGRVLAGISISLCSLVFGFASLLLYFMSIFTNHDYTFENMNMIFASPVLLAGFPLGLAFSFTKNQEKKVAYSLILRLIWALTVVGIIITILLKLFPVFYQQNLTDIMLMLPLSLLFVFQPVGLLEDLKRLQAWIRRR